MARAIFYKPRPRWHFLGSLAAAVAIELTAVAIASIHRGEEIPEEISMPSAPVDAVITELPPESTPPPEEEPPPPPPPPDEPTEFTIQEPTPPPRPPHAPPRSRDRKSRRIKARATAGWLTIRRLGLIGPVRRTLFTLTKRGGPSRPAAADSSSPLMTVAMQRTSQPPRALGARFSIRLRSIRSCAGAVSRAFITRSLCRLPIRCKAPNSKRTLPL